MSVSAGAASPTVSVTDGESSAPTATLGGRKEWTRLTTQECASASALRAPENECSGRCGDADSDGGVDASRHRSCERKSMRRCGVGDQRPRKFEV